MDSNTAIKHIRGLSEAGNIIVKYSFHVTVQDNTTDLKSVYDDETRDFKFYLEQRYEQITLSDIFELKESTIKEELQEYYKENPIHSLVKINESFANIVFDVDDENTIEVFLKLDKIADSKKDLESGDLSKSKEALSLSLSMLVSHPDARDYMGLKHIAIDSF